MKNEETANEIERVEVHIGVVKEAIALADKLDALYKVPEFKEVIIEGFMEREPARIASIITDPSLLGDEDQRELLGAFKAVGYLGNYLRNIEKRGIQMKQALAQAEQYKDELRNPNKDED